MGLKFLNVKDFEVRDSYEDYYLTVLLVLFVLLPKLRQFTGIKVPGIVERERFFHFKK